ncbi:MAG: YgiQ family radical SAM protein [Methanomicrobiales archaeon]|nr:YgiQ family radical SAM protein [Methanomicrobiales archaeon]
MERVRQHRFDLQAFLPLSRGEAAEQGIEEFDIVLVSGDAYVDHPLFCTALIGRVLQDRGFSVGIIAQPDWRSNDDFMKLGAPRLFFGVTSGNADSMVNAYTARRMRRRKDVYSPGGIPLRPDRATIVYAERIHAMYPEIPVVIGGIEASLRRFAQYDYWEDRVRQSILADAPADLLVFGMGERQVVEIASRLEKGADIPDMQDIPGLAWKMSISTWRNLHREKDWLEIPDYRAVAADPKSYARAFALHYQEQDPVRGRTVVQVHPKTVIVQNRPAKPLFTAELDHIYELPYTRNAHPSYRPPVPALESVQFSVVSHRGCFGGCSFCSLTHHQGRIIQSRSMESLVREVKSFTRRDDFKGVVQDVGGPTANMYLATCPRWETGGACHDRACSVSCPSLELSLQNQITLLRRLRSIPGVKQVFIGSGIRHDLVCADPSPYLEEICRHHVSGHLKVAPEHVTDAVTACMNKPGYKIFEEFRNRFADAVSRSGKKLYLLPYFMSGHPGCTIEDMVFLAEYMRDHHLYPEQVQDFTPTPMTASTTMYYTGLNPFTMEPVHVPKEREKRVQRALLHFRDRRNYHLVREGVLAVNRPDLIGREWKCLIPERPEREKAETEKSVRNKEAESLREKF